MSRTLVLAGFILLSIAAYLWFKGQGMGWAFVAGWWGAVGVEFLAQWRRAGRWN